MSESKKYGNIIVGKRTYNGDRYIQTPTPCGYTTIIVMIKTDYKTNNYGTLSLYNLKTIDGIIIENKWQFSKVYKFVSTSNQNYSGSN